jgi:hypothetical protein
MRADARRTNTLSFKTTGHAAGSRSAESELFKPTCLSSEFLSKIGTHLLASSDVTSWRKRNPQKSSLIAEFYLVDRGLRHRLPGFSSLGRLVILP